MYQFSAVFSQKTKKSTASVLIASMLLTFLQPAIVLAAAMVTPATGGTAIGNSTAGGAFTSLTGPVITESVNGEVGVGGITLNAPSGFEFNTGSTATLTVTAGTCATGNPVQLTGGASSEMVTPTASSITFTVTAASTGDADCASTLTFSGIQVRPTSSTPLASGNMTLTATITGVTGSTNMGTLTMVDNTAPAITLTGANPQEIQIGDSYTELGATAADDIDGDITGSIIIDASAVNTSVIGSYTVTYNVSDIAGNAATQVTRTVNVVKKNTTTALVSDTNPSTISQNVTFTATVTGFSPTGSVQFLSGAMVLSTETLTAGQATFTTSALVVGTSSITASYLGDSQNNTSVSSPALQQVVNKSPTSTATLSAPDPTIVSQNVTFTVTVTGVMPTGTVEFYSGATLLGTAMLSTVNATTAQAMLTTNTLPVGTYTIHGQYLGDGNNNASTTNTVDMHIVNKSPTSTATLSAPDPSVVGQNATFTVTVTGVTPTGTVEIYSGATLLGTAMLTAVNATTAQATFTTNTLGVGTYTIHGQYLGDSNNNPSTTNTVDMHVVDKETSTTTAVSAPNSSIVGNNVTFTATVTGFNPTGTVEFYSGAVLLGTATLTAVNATTSQAAFTTNQLVPAGTYSITASYLGDGNNLPSASTPAIMQVVDKSGSTTTAISVPNASIVGDNVKFTAEVFGFNPTGTVEFLSGSTVIGTATLMNLTAASGSAMFTTNQLVPAGTYSITASYLGDGNNLPSVSAPAILQVVNKKQSVSVATSAPNPAILSDIITFDVSVTGFNPTGMVSLLRNGEIIDQTTLNGSGQASFIFRPTVKGTFAFSVYYGGDGNNLSSTSNVIEQVIRGNKSRNTARTVIRQITQQATVAANSLEGAGTPQKGEDAPVLSDEQIALLCETQATIIAHNAAIVIEQVALIYSDVFEVDAEIIEALLRDSSVCSEDEESSEVESEETVEEISVIDPTEMTEAEWQRWDMAMREKANQRRKRIAAEEAQKRARERRHGTAIAFPVDEHGVPVSSDPIWNACIRRYPIFQPGSHKPVNCRRFHEGHTWEHPDLNISFKWSDRYMKQLDMRQDYVLVTVPTPKYIVQREVKTTHVQMPIQPASTL